MVDNHSVKFDRILDLIQILLRDPSEDIRCHQCEERLTEGESFSIFINPEKRRVSILHTDCFIDDLRKAMNKPDLNYSDGERMND